MNEDQHLVVLQAIWGEMKSMNARMNGMALAQDQTNARLDQTNSRLDQTNAVLATTVERLDEQIVRMDRMERRQVEMEVRLSTELLGVVGAVNEVRDLLREQRVLTPRLDRLEHRVEVLEGKNGTRKPRR